MKNTLNYLEAYCDFVFVKSFYQQKKAKTLPDPFSKEGLLVLKLLFLLITTNQGLKLCFQTNKSKWKSFAQ